MKSLLRFDKGHTVNKYKIYTWLCLTILGPISSYAFGRQANQAPVLNPIGNQSFIIGQTVSFTASASDADNEQSLTYSLENGPEGASIDPVSGVFRYTPDSIGIITVTVRVTDDATLPLWDEEEVTLTVMYPPIRINCGGTELNTASGLTFVSDRYTVNSSDERYFPDAAIEGTANPELYRTFRSGDNFSYNIPVTNGNYQVILHFAEVYYTSANQRKFSINLEGGEQEIKDLDVFVSAGGANKTLISTYLITVSDGILNLMLSSSISRGLISAIEVLPAISDPSLSTVRINCGGPEIMVGKTVFSADQYFTDSSESRFPGTTKISNTTNDELYRTFRSGDTFSYTIPVANGNYQVILHFAEIYYTSANQRKFSVNLEGGEPEAKDLDIFVSAGGANRALTNTYIVTVADGVLDLVFTSTISRAMISAIEVIPLITNPGGGDPSNPEITLKLFPNPSNSGVIVEFESTENLSATVKIYNLQGVLIETHTTNFIQIGSEKLLVLNQEASLASGLYVVKVETNGRHLQKKLIINR
ncbi:malectin domain-containing carbohydrate-binding protein [Cytophagaceae bacterium DM2B3-1]|uniref:Malectin domain-containing carbohydrate-binding protein n=1 Tax=Xanthocytophaga flava TaxID=3048013 RepID=A0ABT7CX69_9BACT|nr:malectin domain-containing carbohydrate-binding protein [Xanthocytophaga flavus]MDJ1498096.1 malectin domain-containing carbohydrate-binding protein [Xanthocytophaga flavus]